MSLILDGTAGVTFPNSTIQASAGSVLQVVNATNTTQYSTSSSSFGSTGITASITPKFSTSKILIFVSAELYQATASVKPIIGIARNSTVVTGDIGLVYSAAGGAQSTVGVNYLDSPATTSSTSYTVYLRSGTNGTIVYLNPDSTTSVITLMEIAQ